MKIKIFQSISENTVEKKVNKFIEENDIEVIEMQFRATIFYFAVMITYKAANTRN